MLRWWPAGHEKLDGTHTATGAWSATRPMSLFGGRRALCRCKPPSESRSTVSTLYARSDCAAHFERKPARGWSSRSAAPFGMGRAPHSQPAWTAPTFNRNGTFKCSSFWPPCATIRWARTSEREGRAVYARATTFLLPRDQRRAASGPLPTLLSGLLGRVPGFQGG